MYTEQAINSLVKANPLLRSIIDLKPVTWFNPNRKRMQEMPKFPIQKRDMVEATELWQVP